MSMTDELIRAEMLIKIGEAALGHGKTIVGAEFITPLKKLGLDALESAYKIIKTPTPSDGGG